VVGEKAELVFFIRAIDQARGAHAAISSRRRCDATPCWYDLYHIGGPMP
jgi:hypothetical protein